eukprot:5065288-Pleurochrysis_carterae.AAC.3
MLVWVLIPWVLSRGTFAPLAVAAAVLLTEHGYLLGPVHGPLTLCRERRLGGDSDCGIARGRCLKVPRDLSDRRLGGHNDREFRRTFKAFVLMHPCECAKAHAGAHLAKDAMRCVDTVTRGDHRSVRTREQPLELSRHRLLVALRLRRAVLSTCSTAVAVCAMISRGSPGHVCTTCGKAPQRPSATGSVHACASCGGGGDARKGGTHAKAGGKAEGIQGEGNGTRQEMSTGEGKGGTRREKSSTSCKGNVACKS